MADYYINFNHQGHKDSSKKLLSMMDDIKENDEIIISVEADNHQKMETITDILEKNGFEYLPKGDEGGRRFSIIAHLKNH